MRIEPPSDSSTPYFPEFWTTRLPGAWIESCPSGSISIRRPWGMMRVGAAGSGVLRLMNPAFLRFSLSSMVAVGRHRQRLEDLERRGRARRDQQPVLVRPMAVENVDQRIHGTVDAASVLAADLVVEAWAGGPAGVAHGGEQVPPLHPLSGADLDALVVAEEGEEAVAVLHDHQVAVAVPVGAAAERHLPREGDDAVGRGIDGGADRRREIGPGVDLHLVGER